MGKYDLLKASTDLDIYGVSHVEDYSSFIRYKGELVIIHGFPACPECNHVLGRTFWYSPTLYKESWSCPECNTIWSNEDLIQAIWNGREIR